MWHTDMTCVPAMQGPGNQSNGLQEMCEKLGDLPDTSCAVSGKAHPRCIKQALSISCM